MIEVKNKKECCGCHACYNICPRNAIIMEKDDKGFKYPVVDKEKCINCDLCKKVCPIINSKKIENEPIAYACYNKDNEVRKDSSSGGIFTLIASKIISNRGVVFGASFDSEFNVQHIEVNKIEELEKLRGSKYVQSNIGDIYRRVKQYLEEGKEVLFTGTPCQIEGLKTFLTKEYENLYTQDIICHGVPSPKAWEKYKEYRKKEDKEKPLKISFRNKESGWSRYKLNFKYEKKEYKNNPGKDIYMQAFLQDLSLRDSCYSCKFKKYNRLSDITLADFWGIDKILPDMNDNKGTSLVVINSAKGRQMFENIKNDIIYKNIEIEKALKFNPSMTKSVKENLNREKFFKEINNKDFDKVVKKYLRKDNIFKKILRKLKSFKK